MANLLVALDLGSDYITAVCTKTGYIIKEPSVLAVDAVDSTVINAAGLAALRLIKHAGSRAALVHPIVNGSVADKKWAEYLLKYIFAKVLPKNTLFTRMVVHCVVPCALTTAEKQRIEYVLNMLSVKQTRFIPAPIAASRELFKEFGVNSGIICDIGADKTDIALVSGVTILSGATLYHSGTAADKDIVSFVAEKYNISITEQEAEQIKKEIGSLYPNDTSFRSVYGLNAQKGSYETVEVTAAELFDILSSIISKAAHVAESLLASLPSQTVQGIKSNGVFLCGGMSRLAGIDRFFIDKLKLNVRVSENPDLVNVKGAADSFE